MLKKWLAGMFQPELDALKAEHQKQLSQQADEHRQALSQAQRETEQLRQERDNLQGLAAQLEQARAENQQLQAALQQSQLAQQGASEQQQQLQALQTEAEQLRARLADAEAGHQGSEAQRAAIEAQLAETQQQLQQQLQRIETLEAEKNLLQVRAQMQAPVAPVAPAAVGEQLIRPPARERKRVLIVDDAATTRILQKNMLESAGYEVVMGNDGLQGQALVSEQMPDLVITDIEMPKMNGFELTSWIKQSPYREVPVLMVTSHSDEAFQQKGLQAGADGFVEKKSFNQKTFLEIIQHYV